MPKKYNPETGKTALHLVGSISPSLQERRLTLGNHFADIVVSKREKNLCYFVLQRFGSAEILEMQRFENPEDAETAARDALRQWNVKDEAHSAAS